jgi:hypothetical protein
MVGHGPDAETYDKYSAGGAVDPKAAAASASASSASAALPAPEPQKPFRMPDDSMSFMFESTYVMRLTEWYVTATTRAEVVRCDLI